MSTDSSFLLLTMTMLLCTAFYIVLQIYDFSVSPMNLYNYELSMNLGLFQGQEIKFVDAFSTKISWPLPGDIPQIPTSAVVPKHSCLTHHTWVIKNFFVQMKLHS